jgi:anti-sigma factor RsiW
MHDPWTQRLSEYLDDELPAAERATLERHLAVCPDCARTLEDLGRVVATAATLRPRPPSSDLWPGVAARLAASSAENAPGPAAWAFARTQLVAAGVLIALLAGWTAWNLIGEVSRPAPSLERIADTRPGGEPASVPAALSDAQYEQAVADLERAVDSRSRRLDETTLAIVQENLDMIDRAIADARLALANEPADEYLTGHLAQTRRRKLDVLRQVAAWSVNPD